MASGVAMAQARVARINVFTARVDRLAADWILARQTREAAAETGLAGFCERVQTLCADVDSGVGWRNTNWNSFEVLRLQRKEDAHTHMIARLLRPTEPHGLKDSFLKAFFEKAFGRPAPAGTLECRVTVKKRIDGGEVDIEVKGPRWWLIVENKIDSEENEGQTEKYAAYYKRFARLGESLFLVFLSPAGILPESPDFTSMTYRDLREALESACESIHPAPEADPLIRHFLQNLRDIGALVMESHQTTLPRRLAVVLKNVRAVREVYDYIHGGHSERDLIIARKMLADHLRRTVQIPDGWGPPDVTDSGIWLRPYKKWNLPGEDTVSIVVFLPSPLSDEEKEDPVPSVCLWVPSWRLREQFTDSLRPIVLRAKDWDYVRDCEPDRNDPKTPILKHIRYEDYGNSTGFDTAGFFQAITGAVGELLKLETEIDSLIEKTKAMSAASRSKQTMGKTGRERKGR
jgi:hypothetical protein